MGILKLILGPSGSGKTETVYRDAIARASENLRKNVIVVVPEQTSHAVTADFIERTKGGGILNIDVLGFARFAHRIFDSAGGDTRELLDDTGKNLILRRVASKHAEELKILGKHLRKQGYISEIKSVISEFIQYDINSDVICTAAAEDGLQRYLSTKLEDISVLYRAFREELGTKYITKEELLDLAIRSAERSRFIKGASIYFDSYTGFTPIQYRFIRMLMNYAEDITVALDYDGSDGDFFNMSVVSIAELRRLAEECGWSVETERLYDNGSLRLKGKKDLSFLEEKIFRKKPAVYEEKPEHIHVTVCSTPAEEVRSVCRKIVEIMHSSDLRYREIGVVLSDTGTYASLLRREAARFKIPLFVDETNAVTLNPFVEMIRAALGVEAENYSYETVFHFLRTGLTEFTNDEIDKTENYVRAMNIRGRKKYRMPWVYHTKEVSEEDLEKLNKIRERIAELFDPLDEVMKKRGVTAGEYTRVLREFAERECIKERLEARCEEFAEKGLPEKSAEYKQIYEKIAELFERIENLIPDEKMTLKEYLETLNAGFDEIRVGIIPPGLDTLNAGDMTRSRLGDIKVLFFLGLNESLIPHENKGSGILSDFDREFLKKQNIKLSPTASEKIGEEKLYFYMNITKPKEQLYLSYSETDLGGKAKRVSFFLNVVKKLFPKLETQKYSEDSLEGILTSEDAMRILGKGFEEEPNERTEEIYRFFKNESGYARALKLMMDAAFFDYRADPISKAAAKALYGDNSNASASRLERYAACAYQHFLQYGLKLREREEFGFERKDMGTLLHGVLQMCSAILQDEGKTFSDLQDNETEELAKRALDRFLKENENVVLTSSKRNEYFITRMARILRRTVSVLTSQAKKGEFKTTGFEKNFSYDGFAGRIDRIDTADDGNKIYVSVIDYKSGNKDFDISRIYYGLDLQLVIYMNAAMEIEKIELPDKEAETAGIFYYHIDDPVVNETDIPSATKEDADKKISKELKLRGIVNGNLDVIRLYDREFAGKSDVIPVETKKDGSFAAAARVLEKDGFRVLSEFVKHKTDSFRESIMNGDVSKYPVKYDKQLTCDYCAYRDVCFFDERLNGYKARAVGKLGSTDEVIMEMKKELGEDVE
ncbi:DNA helicase/exodeoxyribonuclease V, subunit B [Lachnospiraceae bacterium KH1T2]|nr:DNA helicase/exodeoxyribonuclease V, subunit B [Lachnospiraceae bacterium KH1T2]